MDVFSDYLLKINNPEHRARTEEVLEWVSATFKELEPRVAWNQPMFTDHGTLLLDFAAPVSIFPFLQSRRVWSTLLKKLQSQAMNKPKCFFELCGVRVLIIHCSTELSPLIAPQNQIVKPFGENNYLRM